MSRYHSYALAGAGLIAAAAAYASQIEPRTIVRREMDMASPTLPSALDGLKIAFMSDIHLGGPGDPLGSVHRALMILEEQKPDLILLGGDYYDRGVRVPCEPDWSRLPEIAPTFAVPGNHDYYRDQETTQEIMRLLAASGINVLRNQSADIDLEGGTARIIGLDDPYTGRADLKKALERDADVFPTIMLAHAGLVADDLPVGSADLILSGHTHGAQISLSPFRHTGPLDIFWWLDVIKGKPASPYRQGLFRVRGSLLYVGNGLGTTTLGARFMAQPEVAIFRLYRHAGHESRSCDDAERYLLRYDATWTWPDIK